MKDAEAEGSVRGRSVFLLVLLTRADSNGVLSNTNLFEEATLSHIILSGPKAAGTKRMRGRRKRRGSLSSLCCCCW